MKRLIVLSLFMSTLLLSQDAGCMDESACNYDIDATASCDWMEFDPPWNDNPDEITDWAAWCNSELGGGFNPAGCQEPSILQYCYDECVALGGICCRKF